MSIEVVVLKKEDGGFSLWIDGDQDFHHDSFLELIMVELEIQKTERVHTSFGPASLIDDFHTPYGVFSMRLEFDEFPGATLSSDNIELIKKIRHIILKSGQYHLRSKP